MAALINDISEGLKAGEKLPLRPEARRIVDASALAGRSRGKLPAHRRAVDCPISLAHCQTPTHIFFLFEGNIHSCYRQIFHDGRKHPDDLDPTWYGYSVGRFEGKTLVVDTIGYNDKTRFDFKGNPHTEKLHTVERYSFDAKGKLVNEVRIEDAGSYEKPFTVTFTAERAQGALNSWSISARRTIRTWNT